jgi:UbiD family decarboxylase
LCNNLSLLLFIQFQLYITILAYPSLRHAIEDLPGDQLLRIEGAIDPNLEIGEIHRRVFHAGGPALFFEKVKGSPFVALSNRYGTKERTAYLFRHQLEGVQRLIQLKADPSDLLRHPGKFLKTPFTAMHGLPLKARWNKPVCRLEYFLNCILESPVSFLYLRAGKLTTIICLYDYLA